MINLSGRPAVASLPDTRRERSGRPAAPRSGDLTGCCCERPARAREAKIRRVAQP